MIVTLKSSVFQICVDNDNKFFVSIAFVYGTLREKKPHHHRHSLCAVLIRLQWLIRAQMFPYSIRGLLLHHCNQFKCRTRKIVWRIRNIKLLERHYYFFICVIAVCVCSQPLCCSDNHIVWWWLFSIFLNAKRSFPLRIMQATLLFEFPKFKQSFAKSILK